MQEGEQRRGGGGVLLLTWAALHSPITVTLQDLMTLKLRLNGFNLNPGEPGLKQEAEAEILRLSTERSVKRLVSATPSPS